MRPLESAVSQTRRNIRFLLYLGGALALLSASGGLLLFALGRPRPDVTLTFSEFGEYVAVLGAIHLGLYAGLFWQVGRLSRRARPQPAEPAAVPVAKLLE